MIKLLTGTLQDIVETCPYNAFGWGFSHGYAWRYSANGAGTGCSYHTDSGLTVEKYL